MTVETMTASDDVASLAQTVRHLTARNVVLEAENSRLKAALAAKEPKITGLTPKQRQLLDFIVGYQRSHRGDSPSFEQMAKGVGLASRGAVHRLITCLEERRAIARDPNRARAIQVLASSNASTEGGANG